MAINLNSTTPAAPTGGGNVTWQEDGSGNVSAYVTGADVLVGINTQTASYHAVLADAGALIRMNDASANSVTIDPDATTDFPAGSTVSVRQVGAGTTTIAAGAGVTITTPSSLILRVQYSTVQLIKVAADTWDLAGDTQ